MPNPTLLILPGDGIGPEVMAEVRKIIGWYGERRGLVFDVSEDLVGGAAYDVHGVPLSDATMAKAQEVDAVLQFAVSKGAELLKVARKTDYGGYSGYFADPDGHPWEVVVAPGIEVADDGRLHLPD